MTFFFLCDKIYSMKDIIERLNQNGYDAFIVGGYVRDYLLGLASNDVDIATNAPIDEIIRIFKKEGKAFKEFYSYHIVKDGYSIDITTFRRELKYKRNKPVKLEIAGSLGEDLLRRDFTINTFAIDNMGRLVDLLGAKHDLNARVIRVVNNEVMKKFTEDKTRILRAIRFSCVLDFDLNPDIVNFIYDGKTYMLNEVSKEFKRKELDKIFDSVGVEKFFYIANRYNISKYLNIKYEYDVIKTYNRYGIWAQIESDLPFTKKEIKKINAIRKLVESKNITYDDFKNNDIEVVYNAASILRLEAKVKVFEEISKLHSIIDIDLNLDAFLDIVKPGEATKVYRLIEKSIMDGVLVNRSSEIKEFIRKL